MKKEYGQIIAQSNKNSSPRPKGRKSNLNSRKGLEKSGTKNLPPADGHKSQGNASSGEGQGSLCTKILKLNFIIRANDSWKFQWDILILLIAIFNSITIPLTLSFDEIQQYLSSNLLYVIFNSYFSSFIFFMDILLQMNTTYYDSDG